ncbi:unnamed protein product [Periconia digitata]|uniref:Glutathione synthetase n=1 Tax=Periconia digitata TaxID=1303443 RepID=A0A9W4XTB3_9PLEO|nr:unnamed protein product [Periconia digitata]
MLEAYSQCALRKNQTRSEDVSGHDDKTDPIKLFHDLRQLFDPDLPLHLLKGEEPGMDIHLFIHEFSKQFGTKPRIIHPADLRLLHDPSHPSGYRLFCKTEKQENAVVSEKQAVANDPCHDESVEEVHQIGLELHQHELAALTPEMQRQISLLCFNDMRSVLLVHDKRMLGIIRQEIPNMLSREVITQSQADALKWGIVETVLSKSLEAQSLLQNSQSHPNLKNDYILKPIRSGKGDGIIFGEDLTDYEWINKLEGLQSINTQSLGTSYVAQRRIVPLLYNLTLNLGDGETQYPLVGTYHVVNGKFVGTGIWRSSLDRVVAVTHGGAWLSSVTCE